MRSDLDYAAIRVDSFERGSAKSERAERLLGSVTGVRWVYANALTETIYIQFDPALCSSGILLRVPGDEGFQEICLA